MSASPPRRKRRGLVLGGGGVLGGSWTIGAMAALEELTGWDVREADVLVGTSAGSTLAGLVANGVGTQSLLNHQRGTVTPGDPEIGFDLDGSAPMPGMPRLRIGSSKLLVHSALHPLRVTPMGAVSGLLPEGRGSLRFIGDLIETFCPPGEWAPRDNTWIVTMDYATGKRVVFGRDGSPLAGLSDAIMASCAIPGWFAPVDINGRRYVDGGTCSPTSLDLVAPLQLDEVVVLAPMVSFEYDRPTSRIARLERGWRRLQTRRLMREAEKVKRAGTSVVMLGPGAEDLTAIGANLMDPRRRSAVLETSLRTSAAALKQHYSWFAAAG